MRFDTPDSLKNLTTQTLWWCGLFAFYPASRRLGGKKVETNDAFPWLPLFSSSAVSRPGIRWGNTEAATNVSVCSAGCCGVFGFALTAMTRQLGNGDPRRTVPGLWGTSRRVIGWVLTDSSGRQPVPGKEQCSPGISPVPCSAARSLLSLSPRGGPSRSDLVRPGQVTMLARGGRMNGRMTWSARIQEIGVCLARFSTEHRTNSRVFLT